MALTGCSRLGGITDDQSAQQRWSEHQQKLAEIDSWDLHARAVVRRPGEVYNIGLQWKQGPRRFVMLLEAPFGQGVFRIDAAPGEGYRLRLPDGRIFNDRTPEALLDQVIGWSLPVSGMQYWIRGMPGPGSEYRHRIDASARTRSIRQDSWEIGYIDYFDGGREPRLPRRIKMVQNELTIKLVIERWQQSAADQTSSDLFPEFD